MYSQIIVSICVGAIVVCILLLIFQKTLWIGIGVMIGSIFVIMTTLWLKDKFSVQRPRSMNDNFNYSSQVDMNNDEW